MKSRIAGLLVLALTTACATAGERATAGDGTSPDAETERSVRLLIALGITRAEFGAFDPRNLDASEAGTDIFGDYPTTDASTCRIAAALMGMKLMAAGPERTGAAVARCGDALWATAVVNRDEVELSHGEPGNRTDVRTAPRR